MERKIRRVISKKMKTDLSNAGVMIACSDTMKSDYKKVTFVYLEKDLPKYVAKKSKRKTYGKKFIEEFKNYESFYKKTNMKEFPKPIFFFKDGKIMFSLEEGIHGKRMVPSSNWKKDVLMFLNFFKRLAKKNLTKANVKTINLLREIIEEIGAKISLSEKNILKEIVERSKKNKWITYLGDSGYGNILVNEKGIRVIDWEKNKVTPRYSPVMGFLFSYFSYLRYNTDKKHEISLKEIVENKELMKILETYGVVEKDLKEYYVIHSLLCYDIHRRKNPVFYIKKIKESIKMIKNSNS